MEEVKNDVVKILADPSDHLGTQVVMNYPRGWGGSTLFRPLCTGAVSVPRHPFYVTLTFTIQTAANECAANLS